MVRLNGAQSSQEDPRDRQIGELESADVTEGTPRHEAASSR
jgi:hypothetical protein